ncbi:MAG: TolC family protein [Marinilabiliaceae bacterium]|nr:TolC family protein [Marinilabiliaceae bacterium]
MKVGLLLIFLAVHILATGQDTQLSLQECIALAISNNHEIMDYDYQISSINNDVRNEKQKFLPVMSAQINNGVTSGFQQVFSDLMAGQYETIRAYANNAVFDLSMPIWTANANKVLVSKREIEAESLQSQKANKELDVKFKVIEKFYGIALAQKRYEITLNEKISQDSVLIVTKSLFDIGEKSFRDVVDAESNLEQIKYELKLEEYKVENARRQLADIVRIDELPYITIDDLQIEVELPSFEEFYDVVIAKHPSIRCQNIMVESADFEVQYYKRSLLPSISLNYQAGTSGQIFDTGKNTSMVSQWKHNAYQTAQINIKIPIFNYTANVSQLSKAKIERDRNVMALERKKLDLRAELQQLYSDMLQSIEVVLSVRKNEEMIRKQYEYAIKDYMLGNMASYELNVYKMKNKEAQLSSIQAGYELRYKYAIFQLIVEE